MTNIITYNTRSVKTTLHTVMTFRQKHSISNIKIYRVYEKGNRTLEFPSTLNI